MLIEGFFVYINQKSQKFQLIEVLTASANGLIDSFFVIMLVWLKKNYSKQLKEMNSVREKAKHNNLMLIAVGNKFVNAVRAVAIKQEQSMGANLLY